jgi:hypothetical protein
MIMESSKHLAFADKQKEDSLMDELLPKMTIA